MASRKRSGRSAAEAAYAALLKDNTALVGDVGEAWDALDAALGAAAGLRERYEESRGAAVKAGAVTNDQLDQMGYRRTPKVPALPARVVEEPHGDLDKGAGGEHGEHSNGVAVAPLASVGANSSGDNGGEDQQS